jgi:hypothetical protein
MINVKFKPEEKLLIEIQEEFNILSALNYPTILQWNHYELWQKSGKMFNPEDWKRFRLHDKVDEWYTEEIILIAKQKQVKLLSTAGDRTSVADSQALNQVTAFLERNKNDNVEQVKIIYSFVPLNENEEKAENVRIINNIPTEIEDAIVRYSRNK